jgi:hypothetical protein
MSATRPIIAVGQRRVAIDLPHLIFATAIAAWIAWFCRDAWLSQPDVENMILILPASVFALIVYGFIVASCCRVLGPADAPAQPTRAPLAPGMGIKIAGSMALLGGYGVAGPMIGFDVSSFVYMLAMMAFLGERKIIPLLLIPLLFSAAVTYGFNVLLATPLPMVFFHGDS